MNLGYLFPVSAVVKCLGVRYLSSVKCHRIQPASFTFSFGCYYNNEFTGFMVRIHKLITEDLRLI